MKKIASSLNVKGNNPCNTKIKLFKDNYEEGTVYSETRPSKHTKNYE